MDIKPLPSCKCNICGYTTWCMYDFTEGICSKCKKRDNKKASPD